MQLFILLYIEGGSYIVEDETVWEFVILYVRFAFPAFGGVFFFFTNLLPDTKNESGEALQIHQHTISSDTPLFIPFIVSQKKFA